MQATDGLDAGAAAGPPGGGHGAGGSRGGKGGIARIVLAVQGRLPRFQRLLRQECAAEEMDSINVALDYLVAGMAFGFVPVHCRAD